jgi:hypothetical protein
VERGRVMAARGERRRADGTCAETPESVNAEMTANQNRHVS